MAPRIGLVGDYDFHGATGGTFSFFFLRFGRFALGTFFSPPVWPIRTRHGPYNNVSGEKHSEKGHVWSKTAGKSSHQHKQTNQKTQPKTTRKSPSQICVSPKSKTAKQQRTGPGPNKNQTKQLEICLGHSDLSHCIIIKNMQTN